MTDTTWKKLLFSIVPALALYAVVEIVATALDPFPLPRTVVLFEDSGRTVHFDPVLGYTLTRTPSRWARFNRDGIEFLGTLRGNSGGFPDRDDFGPEKSDPKVPRYAVFGDSFSAGQFLELNWPDRAEDLCADRGTRAEFLNFSIDGGGLANWWSILTRRIESERYEIDGVIFAVFVDNLSRGFMVMDHRGQKHYTYSRLPGWDPARWPKTVEEARRTFYEWEDEPNYIVSSPEFERALQGDFRDELRGPFRLVLTTRLLQILRGGWKRDLEILEYPPPGYLAGREPLVADVARYLAAHEIPAWVIFIPWRDDILGGVGEDSDARIDARAFADRIGASYLDAQRMFDGMEEKELRSYWLPVDGHWNQLGSDRFAEFVVDAVGCGP